ncbi:LOW QUALITY PROTEIN: tyrosine-protein phosphatase 10D-like [Galleria mellonella]|uniref:LOW QUALITY PROTEIN: tyrosine-protein phosphatase 10D-like n=1 Tax=Galleria mellonella TaxID=7137 RepID=A0ABM3MZM0_GALME|nr:LOW QUALITY PROTEIN: tyrosine-protein phosphatase 10D-like [Galleria mellonella]
MTTILQERKKCCFSRGYSNVLVEKVSCEIRKSPSMMWKRSIVQATNRCTRYAMALALACLVFVGTWQSSYGADLVIEIPGSGGGGGGADAGADGGRYRLDYRPPHGSPAPNYTVPARASTINFQGLPGTKYHFMLYYSNATFADLLTWNQTIITAPEPPTNLTVTLGRNKQATISWSPPVHGDYTGFRFKVIPLTDRGGGGAQNITVAGAGNWTHTLSELAPGATYQLHAFTLLHDKESAAYASRNFTTRPNTPGKFIVWFRNETTLLVLWQPPYPPGAYTHYKVSIVPPDAQESEQYVEKEGEPPGPAQAAFKGLVPGRAYNISVQTVSEQEASAPTTAQYRTVPLRPRNLSLAAPRAETAARVRWLPPGDDSEFERYQVSVSTTSGAGTTAGRRAAPVLRARRDPPEWTFDGLEPGAHYTVIVKTMSGKVTSWPATLDLTLKPLPVRELSVQPTTGDVVRLRWSPAPGSTQDQYKISYHEAGPSRDDSNTLTTTATNVTLESLLPGRNYTITVSAVSRGAESNESAVSVATRPLAPVVLSTTPQQRSLTLVWHSDVNSRQDGYVLHYRRHTTAPAAPAEYLTLETKETNATLEDLFPGAVYEIQVAAVSHGLQSDPQTVLKPVRPLPPRELHVERVTSDAVEVRWRGPGGGSAVGHYVLQYRASEAAAWLAPPPLPAAAARHELAGMTHGERYHIRLDSASEPAAGDAVLSGAPLSAYHTVRPNPVSNVAQLADTRNMTLEWPRAAGRVDWYELRWWPRDDPAGPARCGGGGGGAAGGAAGAAGADGAAAQSRRLQPAPGPARLERALLDGLQPGLGYGVSIAAHSYNLTSDLFTMDTRTRPLIQSEMTIVNESDGDADADNETLSTTLKVVYTRTPATASRFDSYRWRLEAGEEEAGGGGGGGGGEAPRWEERAADAGGQQVVFSGLVPGRLYNLTMWTVSCNVTSHPVQRQARLFPRPITQLNATAVGAREVTLAWDEPAGVYTDFEVQYLAAADQLQTHYTAGRTITITGLQPHTLYTFTVVVRAGRRGALQAPSRAHSAAARTRQAPPAAPRGLALADAAPGQLRLAWDLPAADRHGVLHQFVLRYEPADTAAADHAAAAAAELRFPPDARAGTVAGLRPGERYSLALWAVNGAGAGAAARATHRLAIGAPPPPPPHATPAEVRRAPTAVAVRFRADYFSPANGNLTAYTLVLAEEPRDDTPPPLPSWRDVHRLPLWPPYQVTEPYYPFASSPVEEFTIGAERCEAAGRTYCNGPLKPGTRYYVKLRAFTAPDKYADTAYAVLYTEVDNTAWVAGACAAGACAALAGGALLLVRRRRAGRRARRRRRRRAPAAPPPAPRAQRPVRVADFRDHYRLMAADSDFRFSEEFEELKHVGREQPCTAADLPCNRPKNRFTNILPYDHSRYKLQPVDDEEGSDYINANYVPGHNSPREFIVTQGPLHCTRDDFWRMCWESGSRAIVMLTRCVEKGREKCDRYWPYDTRPVYYGDIAVTALNESRYPDWTVTELMVCRGAEQRVLKHFHFTTWPDFGVPDPPTTLARFVRAFRDRCPADGRPVVVHCSAGVGRSGTFITLDRALQQLAAHAEYIDIFGMVYAMRRERVWMVQTEQQYICIHQCVVAVLEGQDLTPPPHHPHHNHNHHLNPAFEDDEGIAESGM